MVGPSRQDKRDGNKNHPYRNSSSSSFSADSSRRRPQIGKQEANALERPSRRLFVRNIQFQVTETDIRNLFEVHGPVKNFCDLISNRGICFLTFYDLRAAEKAKNALNGATIKGRNVNIHFSLPKEDANRNSKCDQDKDQGTLLVTMRGVNGSVTNDVLRDYMEKFGQVMNVKSTRTNNVKLVEYYDSRDCVAAFDSIIEHNRFYGGELSVEFEWDDFERLIERPYVPSASIPSPSSSSYPTNTDLNALLQERLRSLKSGNYYSNPASNMINMLQSQSHSMYPPVPMYNMPLGGGSMGGMAGVSYGMNSYPPPMPSMPAMPLMQMPSSSTSSSTVPTPTNPTENLLSQLNPNQLQQILSILNPNNINNSNS